MSAVLKDPFNPKSGEFAENIRSIVGSDDTELSQSMEQFGWVKELPAIADENGVVIVGHRRLRIAKQLQIVPVIQTIEFGSGDEADAERLKIAIASNLGSKAMTADDRKRIATYLYGKREWTMARIASALNVAERTISRDIANSDMVSELKPRTRTTTNPKGAGRPRRVSSKPRAQTAVDREDKVAVLMDLGKTTQEIAVELGVGQRAANQAMEHVKIRREAKAEAAVDPDALSMSAKERLAAAIRQATQKLEQEFAQRVRDEVRSRIEQTVLPAYAEEYQRYRDWIDHRKGCMDRRTYIKILAQLHPDKGGHADLFDIFKKLEKVLLDEKESPTPKAAFPRTYDDLMAMKQKASAARKAARSGKNLAKRR